MFQTCITCMTAVHRDSEEETGASALVLGTEDSNIYILDCTGTHVIDKICVPAIPAYICSLGAFLVDYRLVIG